MTERPVFIPLKAEFFDAFKSGKKCDELRVYGPRWNEGVCRVWRRVVLSLGYGTQSRLTGRIRKFKRQRGETFGRTYQGHILAVYGTLDLWIACLSIDLDEVPA